MRRKVLRRRGRPFGRYQKLADYKSLNYLALISMKYEIDLNDFFNSFVQAWGHQSSTYENFTIKCRKKTRDNAIFLITKGSKVVAQFPISKHILEETNPLKEFTPTKALRRKKAKSSKVKQSRIGDLKAGMKRINLKARIIEIPKPRTVITRLGGSAKVTNASIKDETGIISLPLWNQQIHTVTVGDTIQIENAHVVTFRGEQQIRIGRGGQISVIEKCAHAYTKKP
jgi:hypothetical protein